jgi:hypothetical protein
MCLFHAGAPFGNICQIIDLSTDEDNSVEKETDLIYYRTRQRIKGYV